VRAAGWFPFAVLLLLWPSGLSAAEPTWSLGHLKAALTEYHTVATYFDVARRWPETGLGFEASLWQREDLPSEGGTSDVAYYDTVTLPFPVTVTWTWAPVSWFEAGPFVGGAVGFRTSYWGETGVVTRGQAGLAAKVQVPLPLGYRPFVGVWTQVDLEGRPSSGISLEWALWSSLAMAVR